MLRRLYVHNFRCLENFELEPDKNKTTLLIGRNGTGKTTVGLALGILQRIARGVNRVDDLVKPKDLALGRTEAPMRFEIEVELDDAIFEFSVAFELPEGFRALRVYEEKLSINNKPVYDRSLAKVERHRSGSGREAQFVIDWHLVALPIVHQESEKDPIATFRNWLSRSLLLRPVPSLISGDSEGTLVRKGQSLQPEPTVINLGEWFTDVMTLAPAAYSRVESYLKQVMPDLKQIKNLRVQRTLGVF